jgi:ketosteroid isomerase-like protein
VSRTSTPRDRIRQRGARGRNRASNIHAARPRIGRALHRRWDNQRVAETNVDLARRAFEGVLRGDLDLVRELLDRDVKWHGGDPEAPGACRNRRQALAFIDRARERVRDVEILDVVGAGDKVVVIMGARAADGATAWTAANLSTFRGGKVVEIVHDPDVEDALAAAGATARP